MPQKPLSPRQSAKALGEKTYEGSACARCSSATRYTTTGQCVACHNARAARLYRERHPDARRFFFPRKEAKSLGLQTYDGRPCRRCGTTEKHTSNGSCVNCVRETRRRDRLENPEKYREAARRQYAADPEKALARSRRWTQAHPQRRAETKANWHSNNLEQARDGNRRRYTRWKRANPDKRMENNARRRSRGKSATPKWLRQTGQLALIQALYAKARACRQNVDHDIPIAGCRSCGAIGLHVLANLQLIDPLINGLKNNRCMACFQEKLNATIPTKDHDAEPIRR